MTSCPHLTGQERKTIDAARTKYEPVRFHVLTLPESGGMGDVYRAHDTPLDFAVRRDRLLTT